MLFQTIASIAILATGATAAAAEARQPYRLAVMAMPGQSLMRRDTSGYKPDQKQCKSGNTCAEACGANYAQCPGGKPEFAHCFNAAAGESCCTDNSGNSCEAGYYCTHDNKAQTWCCPNNMDLAACAAAYTATGLVAATSKTPTSTSQPPTTTSKPHTTSKPAVTTTVEKNTTTTICTTSTTKSSSSSWTGFNSTISTQAPTSPSQGIPTVTAAPPPAPTNVNAAAASGVSALLLVAAGVIALL